MNLFKLKEYSDNKHIVYRYQPEGRGEWGEVIYTYSDGNIKIVKRAGENSAAHDRMALAKVKERTEKNSLFIEFIQAWHYLKYIN